MTGQRMRLDDGGCSTLNKDIYITIQWLESISEEGWKECKGEEGQGCGGSLSSWHSMATALLNPQQVNVGRYSQDPSHMEDIQAVNNQCVRGGGGSQGPALH